MIDLKLYVGDPIVMITNEQKSRQLIENIDLPGTHFLILYNDSYYLARNLLEKDLLDEDFLAFVGGFWDDQPHLEEYLQNHVKVKHVN